MAAPGADGANVQSSNDEAFDREIELMNSEGLLITVADLQRAMAEEQRRFDTLGGQLQHGIPTPDELSQQMMQCQTRLAMLMARNMKCFTQQAALENKELSANANAPVTSPSSAANQKAAGSSQPISGPPAGSVISDSVTVDKRYDKAASVVNNGGAAHTNQLKLRIPNPDSPTPALPGSNLQAGIIRTAPAPTSPTQDITQLKSPSDTRSVPPTGRRLNGDVTAMASETPAAGSNWKKPSASSYTKLFPWHKKGPGAPPASGAPNSGSAPTTSTTKSVIRQDTIPEWGVYQSKTSQGTSVSTPQVAPPVGGAAAGQTAPPVVSGGSTSTQTLPRGHKYGQKGAPAPVSNGATTGAAATLTRVSKEAGDQAQGAERIDFSSARGLFEANGGSGRNFEIKKRSSTSTFYGSKATQGEVTSSKSATNGPQSPVSTTSKSSAGSNPQRSGTTIVLSSSQAGSQPAKVPGSVPQSQRPAPQNVATTSNNRTVTWGASQSVAPPKAPPLSPPGPTSPVVKGPAQPDTRTALLAEVQAAYVSKQKDQGGGSPADGSRVTACASNGVTSSSGVSNGLTELPRKNDVTFTSTTPIVSRSEGFTTEDKVKDKVTLKSWDPTLLLKDLYRLELQTDTEEASSYINMEGYMEKLPTNKKKATLLKTWKRRYFRASEGNLYYYENTSPGGPSTGSDVYQSSAEGDDRASAVFQLMGGVIEDLGSRMLGVDDGRGHYLITRCPTDQEFNDWKRALESQTVGNIRATYIKPDLRALTNPNKSVVVIDLGSCSVRAGILGDRPALPEVFFPTIVATHKETGERRFGFDAWSPEVRGNSHMKYPVLPTVRVDKFSLDMSVMPDLMRKVFHELKVDPREHWVMFSAPASLSDKFKEQFMDVFVRELGVKGVNIANQTVLSLYSYSAKSGIVVDIGDRLEIVPVTDGYIVEGGMTRQPYGGHRVAEAFNADLTEHKYSFFTDVEFQIVRFAMEKMCFLAVDHEAACKRSRQEPGCFQKSADLEKYQIPAGSFSSVTSELGRFNAPEGLFNPDVWGMDNPSLQSLVQKAVQACPMDTRREMWRSVYLSGGATALPGFAEKLTAELTKLVPPSIVVQVHASPQRYHAAFVGACTLANMAAFEQSCITSDEWLTSGTSVLQRWNMY